MLSNRVYGAINDRVHVWPQWKCFLFRLVAKKVSTSYMPRGLSVYRFMGRTLVEGGK